MKTTKKFLLTATALAVITSTSAFASAGIDIIKTDAITVNLDGDLDLKILNKGNGTTIEANWDDFDASLAYKIDDRLTFLAGTDWSMEEEYGSSLYNKGIYMGFAYDDNKIMAGSQEISFDKFGVDHSEVAFADESSGYHDGNKSTWHNTAFVYTYSLDNGYISATYAKGSGDEDKDQDASEFDVYQVLGFMKTHGFELMGGIGQTKGVKGADADALPDYESVYGQLEAVYNYGNGQVGINVAMEDDKDAFTSTGVDLDFTYKMTKKATLNLGASFITQDYDDDTDIEDYNSMYAGVTYKFNKYVILYTEISQEDGQKAQYGYAGSEGEFESDADNDHYVGMYLNFQY